jgi:hypothetical protein
MTDQFVTILGIVIAIISGVFGYVIKVWTSSTTDDVKNSAKENQDQAIEITELNGKVELLKNEVKNTRDILQAKVDTIQAKSDLIQEKLNKISDNELVHLKADMENQKDANAKDHTEIKVLLAKISQKLEIS